MTNFAKKITEAPEIEGSKVWFSHDKHAKMKPPVMSSRLIFRPSLVALLEKAADHSLIVISAPAGFGKSTLLSQWYVQRMHQKKMSAWINLDESDAEVSQFLTCTIHSLDRAGMDVGNLMIAAQEGLSSTPVKLVFQRLVESIIKSKTHMLMIFDDYHLAQSKEINQLILDMYQQCHGGITLCLSSRETPVPEFASVLATGEAVGVDSSKLRFSDEEVRIAVGAEVDDATFKELQAKVEGWPIAVQLATLLLNDARNQGTSVAQLHGHTGYLAAYLTEQVIGNLRPALQDFLLRTSILDTFDADLADAVCDHDTSYQLLKELEPLSGLVMPVDNGYTSFRYHHLFAECLRDLLLQRRGQEHESLHLRAAAWLGEHGAYAEAVKHAMAVGCYDMCADMVCRAGGWELVLFGGIGYLNSLLRHFSEDVLKDYPRLQFAKSYLALKNGQISDARARFDSAILSPNFNKDNALSTRDYINLRVLIESYEDNPLLDSPNDFFREAIEAIEPQDCIARGIVQCQMTLWYTAHGQFQLALAQAENAAKSMREGHSVLGLNYCMLHIGMIAFYTGDYQVAMANFQKAVELAEDNFGADSGLKYIATVCLQAVRFWRKGLDEKGARSLQNALDHVREFDGWFEIFAIGFDALFNWAMYARRYDEALDNIEAMQATAEDRGIERLALLCPAFRLMYFAQVNDAHNAELEYERVKQVVVQDADVSPSGTWFVLFFSAHACARYLSAGHPRDAFRYAKRSHEIVAAINADFFVIRASVTQAVVLDAGKRRNEALDALIPALKVASRSEIQQPFMSKDIKRLLRVARGRVLYNEDILVSNLLSDVLGKGVNGNRLLSDREMQVLEELAMGKSNKEIARSLDRTENTVKFHVKNIFTKLQVTRRVQAMVAAKSLNLLE